VLKIVKYGEPKLEQPSEPVTQFNGDLKRLIEDMFETMYAARGVGLAAPQIGVNKRFFVMDCAGGKDPTQKYVMINPEILHTEGEIVAEEGCLSIPGIYSKVTRSQRVVARGYDLNEKEYTLEVTELAARCISHEVDHLDGKLYIFRVSPIKRDLIERKIKKLIKAGEW
jgi:peptide deformylase